MTEPLPAYFLRGMFSFATLFIGICILTYSLMFLQKTEKSAVRRTWEILCASSFIFIAFEILSLLSYFNIIIFSKETLFFVTRIAEFLYSGFILYAFITQHYLINNSSSITISRKTKR